MSYRDDRESARATAERLERELVRARAELVRARRRRFQALPFLVAALLGLVAVSVAAMPHGAPPSPPPAPPPPPEPLLTSPAPSPPAPGAALGGLGALGAAGGPITHFYYGSVVKADGDPRVAVGAACTVSVRALDSLCLVTLTCGDYQPFPGATFASCSFDEQGLPRGQMHFGTPGKSPTDLSMDRGRLTVADTRSGQESVVEIKLRADARR